MQMQPKSLAEQRKENAEVLSMLNFLEAQGHDLACAEYNIAAQAHFLSVMAHRRQLRDEPWNAVF